MITAAPEAPLLQREGVASKTSVQRQRVASMTLSEYYAFEHNASERHEIINGEVFRMPGGSPEHNLIGANIIHAVNIALDLSDVAARVFSSDQKVFINDKTALYPDTSLVVGKAQFDAQEALRNPFAIFEVLSPSTEAFDLGRKFEMYRTVPSLQHYILVDQYRVAVTHYAKIAGDLWAIVGEYSQVTEALKLIIDGEEVAISIATVYRNLPL